MSAQITSKRGNDAASKTDWARVDAMRDEDIVYDEDTGLPLSDADLNSMKWFESHGEADFTRKMKLRATQADAKEKKAA